MASSTDNSSETGIVIDEHGKPCRSCMDFRSWIKMQNSNKISSDSSSNQKESMVMPVSLEDSGVFNRLNIPTEDEYIGRRPVKQHTITKPTVIDGSDDGTTSSWGMGAKYGCPADSVALGNGSWRLLHSMAAYYPDNPSHSIQKDMKDFIHLFSHFYPCFPCAKDFREWIGKHPPLVESKKNLSNWFCSAHNDVNRKLGKPEFDCNLVTQRWSEGWKDGSCD